MAGMLDDIAYLSEEIGPRPAGTEEEQQAALYIAEELQKGAGFTTTIEDFSCNTNADMPKAICFGVAFVATLAAIIFPVVAIPALVLIALAAGIFIAGLLGVPVIDRFTKSGVSQNVVAKYSPNSGNEMKARKIILVANYDSGKESKEYQGVFGRYLHIIRLATIASMCVAFILLFIKTVFFASDTSAASVVLTVLLVICLVLMALPLISCILHKTAQYNNAANNNAAGIGVLLETARSVGSGLVSQEEMENRAAEDGVVVEGEEAVRAAGAMPDGATVTYATQTERELSPEESLAAAKAAIAALTGKPIADTVPVRDVSSNLVQGDGFDEAGHEVEFKFDVTDISQPVHEQQLESYDYEQDYADEFAGEAGEAFDGNDALEVVDRYLNDEPEAPIAENGSAAGVQPAPAAAAAAAATFVPVAAAATGAAAATAASAEAPAAPAAPAADAASEEGATETAEEATAPAASPAPAQQDSNIPAWARAAQEKARANRPDQTPPSRSQRSRYADTVAARLTDEQLEHAHEGARPGPRGSVESGEFRSGWSAFTQGDQAASANESLDERLASLYADINATEAPHFSSEVKSQMESMADSNQSGEAPHGVSADEGQDATVSTDASLAGAASAESAASAGQGHQRRPRTGATNASQTLTDKFQSISKRMKRSQAGSSDEGEAKPERRGHHPEAMRDMPFSEQDQAQLAAEENAAADQTEESAFDRAMDKIDNAAEDLGRTSFISPIDVSGLIERVDGDGPAGASPAAANAVEPEDAAAPEPIEEVEGVYEEDFVTNSADVYAEEDFVETGYEEVGYANDGYSDAGYADAGYTDASYADDDYSDGGYVEEDYVEEGYIEKDGGQTGAPTGDPRFEPVVYEEAEEDAFVNGWADSSQLQWTATPTVETLDDGYAEDGYAEDGYADDGYADDGYAGDAYAGNGYVEEGYAYGEADSGYADEYVSDDAPTAQRHEPTNVARETPQSGRAANVTPAQNAAQAASQDPAAPVAPIAGMENMISSIPAANIVSRETNADVPSRQVIVLPEVQVQRSTVSEATKQRAPMAATNESTRSGSQALLSNMIPKIDAEELAVPEIEAPKDRFGLNLPPLGTSENTNTAVSSTGSFATVGNTGPFAPVTDDLVADLAPDEVYVDDADDSSFEEEFTESGAFAGPGYVDMPTSRVGGFFSRFRSKKDKKKAEPSVRDWVGVDDSFTAQEAGKARGGWESFRQDGGDQASAQGGVRAAGAQPAGAQAGTQPGAQTGAQAGGQSGEAARGQGQASRTKQADANQGGFVDVEYNETDYDSRGGWSGGAFSIDSLRNFRHKKPAEAEPVAEDYDYAYEGEEAVGPVTVRDIDSRTQESMAHERAEQINREMNRIQNFRHPEIDTEVWFVALGAELCGNSGMQAFVTEHREDLKGAIVVNLEAMGAGKLTYIDHEGVLKPMKSSARMKRFLRNASQRSGVSFGTEAMCARTTPAYVAFQHGLQSMTLAGMKDGEPAYLGSMEDTMAIIDENTLQRNASFVLALLKSI